MKKFFAGIAAAAIITVPMTSFALESMSKGALKKATGQAGVSIAIDDIVIYQKSNPTTTYWDTDGMTKYTTGSATTFGSAVKTGIEISYAAESEKVVIIDGILDASTYGVAAMADIINDSNPVGVTGPVAGIMASADFAASTGHDAGNGTTDGYGNGISPLTIDVGTCESLSMGLSWNLGQGGVLATAIPQVAGVIIGLPTVEIQTFHKNNTKSIKLVTAEAGSTGAPTGALINDGKEFISIEKSGHSTMAILGGRIEIAPH